MKLIANSPIERYRTGDVFEAPEQDGALLIAIGKARLYTTRAMAAPPPASVAPPVSDAIAADDEPTDMVGAGLPTLPRRPGHYRRRDQTADKD